MIRNVGFSMGKIFYNVLKTKWLIYIFIDVFVLCLLSVLTYFFGSVEWESIVLIQNVMKCIQMSSSDFLIDIIIDIGACLLQLSLRLYLKFVKKIISSNELLSIKFILLLIFVSFSYFCLFLKVLKVLRLHLLSFLQSCLQPLYLITLGSINISWKTIKIFEMLQLQSGMLWIYFT